MNSGKILVLMALMVWCVGCGGDKKPGDSTGDTVVDSGTVDVGGDLVAVDVGSEVCTPDCVEDDFEKECGSDGCGGVCGICPPGSDCVTMSCTFDGGYCFNYEEECPDICKDHGAQCGGLQFMVAMGSPICQCGDCPDDKPYCTNGHICVDNPDLIDSYTDVFDIVEVLDNCSDNCVEGEFECGTDDTDIRTCVLNEDECWIWSEFEDCPPSQVCQSDSGCGCEYGDCDINADLDELKDVCYAPGLAGYEWWDCIDSCCFPQPEGE